MLMERKKILIYIRFGSCEVQRLNLALAIINLYVQIMQIFFTTDTICTWTN